MAFDSLDALDWLRKQLEQDDADLLREMVKSLAEQLMSADADAYMRGRLRRAQPRAAQLTQRLPPSRL